MPAWYRRLLIVIAGILAALIDASISSWLPGWLGAMTFALPLVAVLAAFSSLERSITAAVATGVVLDLLLPSFGVVAVRHVLIALIIHVLAQTYVTNRSAPGSLALGLIAVAADRVLLWIVVALRGLSHEPFIPEVPPSFIAETGWTMFLMVFAFVCIAALTKRFMPLVTMRR
jgi:hypothetical protein